MKHKFELFEKFKEFKNVGGKVNKRESRSPKVVILIVTLSSHTMGSIAFWFVLLWFEQWRCQLYDTHDPYFIWFSLMLYEEVTIDHCFMIIRNHLTKGKTKSGCNISILWHLFPLIIVGANYATRGTMPTFTSVFFASTTWGTMLTFTSTLDSSETSIFETVKTYLKT